MYKRQIPLDKLNLLPVTDTATHDSAVFVRLPPCVDPTNGMWSAFIDPAHGANFTDEPWLEMAPPMDKQAARLAEVESIKTGAFVNALSIMRPTPMPAEDSTATVLPSPCDPESESVPATLPKISAIKFADTTLGMFLTSQEIEFLTCLLYTSRCV